MKAPVVYMSTEVWHRQARWMHKNGLLTRKELREVKAFLNSVTGECPAQTPLWHNLNKIYLLSLAPANRLPV